MPYTDVEALAGQIFSKTLLAVLVFNLAVLSTAWEDNHVCSINRYIQFGDP